MSDPLLEPFRPRSDSDFTEVALIRRAAPIVDAFGGRLPLQKELWDIYQNFGVELAQTVFAQALERSSVYGPFIRRVRSYDPRGFELVRDRARSFEVTIVRSALPVAGGDFAEQWQTWARSMGFTTDIIETQDDYDLRANARMISTYLFSNPHPRRILITFGQGAAELRSLMNQRMGARGTGEVGEPGELAQIHTWINVAGAYGGAALARVRNQSWFEWAKVEASKYVGRLSVQTRALVWRQLDSRLPVWRTPPNFPPQMQVINIIGMPLRNDLPPVLKMNAIEVTREVGPNDGAVGIYESVAHPGLIVPVPGMTAMAEKYKIEPVLRRVLAIVAES